MNVKSDRSDAAGGTRGAGVRPRPGAAIEGTVTDATGLVLPGVTVEARATESDGPTESTFTDGAGTFAFSGLPPGTYDVTSTLPGFQRDVRRGVALGANAGTRPYGPVCWAKR